MAKSRDGCKSMGDVTHNWARRAGKGFRDPMKKDEGEYCGVDRDAKVLQKTGKGYRRK